MTLVSQITSTSIAEVCCLVSRPAPRPCNPPSPLKKYSKYIYLGRVSRTRGTGFPDRLFPFHNIPQFSNQLLSMTLKLIDTTTKHRVEIYRLDFLVFMRLFSVDFFL